MTRRSFVIASGVAAAVIAVVLAGTPVGAQPYGGGWGMGGGYGPGYGPDCPRWGMRGGGPGFMGRGRGPGWGYDGGWRGAPADLKLSIDDVKTRLERWLAWRGNSRLQLGDVKEKDADTIVADILTKDKSLVERFVVNRHTGFFDRSGD
ncbi:hypothetical protein RA307_24640 [Xanthobacteraceae bacterium Astr-EGSB]|uniref:hypothetical protein n=1 Tax=Astrobacterium formosum TaxID=3069710 RepID=UPI0027B455FB|nr:hypothetical protein [Xanthobacteraceae bacterium Astr-EGSB]